MKTLMHMEPDKSNLIFWVVLTLLTLIYSFFVPHPGIFLILGMLGIYSFYLYRKFSKNKG